MDVATPLHDRPEIYHRRWFLLGVLCLSLVMVVMAVSGLNVALPSMQQALGADATDLQWIVDSYAIVFAGLLLTAGAIGDRFGRKESLIGGLAVFALGSLVGAFAGRLDRGVAFGGHVRDAVGDPVGVEFVLQDQRAEHRGAAGVGRMEQVGKARRHQAEDGARAARPGRPETLCRRDAGGDPGDLQSRGD